MNLGVVLSNLVIGPLELLFEVIYALANRILEPGSSIVVLSLVVNLLVLPLYRRAEEIQQEIRDKEEKLAPGIRHFKETFRGDEQYFMLQTYYRQNHYSPLHSLKSALPLLLQIPFFIAAYQFLSRLGSLQGTALGPIQDLGKPDQLLQLGGITLNLLPILMTGINLLSGALYMKNAPLKSKVQLVGMALVFLVLLYDSPAGLTFYWTLNNLFSLCKNIIQKLLPCKRVTGRPVPKLLRGTPNLRLFILCALLLTLLTGLLIPSAVLSASPQEFITDQKDLHPVWYAVNAFLLAAGTFLVWFLIYYALAGKPVRKAMEFAGWILAVLSLINYLFFRNDLGTISSMLIYDVVPEFSAGQKLVNLGVLAVAALILCFLAAKRERLVQGVALTLVLALCGMSARNLWTVHTEVGAARRVMDRNYSGEMEIPLSKEGKNVVVLMLDRAISSYLPCILSEKPELKDSYSGFVYYPNTLSHGMHTNLGAPGLFGGYEYVPRAMNARNTVSLREKHNEALLLMPALFSQEGYRVSVFNVPYPGNYSETGDYSVFDSIPNTNARELSPAPDLTESRLTQEGLRLRNFFCYSISMIVPSALYGTMYSMGSYNRADQAALLFSPYGGGTGSVYSDAVLEFLTPYEELKNLGKMTTLQEKGNTLLLMVNDTTHSPTTLQEPEYIPGDISGNAAYDEAHRDRFLAGPFPVKVTNQAHMDHYQVNMAALLKVGEWLDQLKDMGVYDNTRIIIVSDHGGLQLFQIEAGFLAEWKDGNPEGTLLIADDVAGANPLLMVKDFHAEGEIRTDTVFMTNADVPTLAMSGILENPVNPFTGNPVDSSDKQNMQYVSFSHSYNISRNHGNQFNPADWYAVTPGGDTLFDTSRWIYQGDEVQ